MEYAKLVEKLSQKTGIDKEIFDLNNSENKDFIKEEFKFYCSGYYYSQNLKERWRSVTLLVSKDIIEEFLTLLVEIYKEEKEKPKRVENPYLKDDMSHIFPRSINHNGLLQIHREKNDNYYRIEFAKKDME